MRLRKAHAASGEGGNVKIREAVGGLILLTRLTSLVAVTAALALGLPELTKSRAEESSAIPKQTHLPSACGEGERQCIRVWFEEYKTGILGEMRQWRQFESRVYLAIQRRDDLDASRMLGEAMRRGWYIHDHWGMADNLNIVAAGIARNDWDALFSDCRAGIIHMKFLLIAVHANSAHPDEIESARAHYVQAVRKCERHFKIAPLNSDLRLAAATKAREQQP
jgi:hypothetical protein